MKKRILLFVHLLLITKVLFAQTPLSMNGRLKLVGNQLSNECGNAIQLRGMSSHAIQAHKNCLTEESMDALANVWKSDLIRLAVYTTDIGESKAYQADSVNWNNWIVEMVNIAEKKGMYAIVDWHILADGNPQTNQAAAERFFATMSRNFKNKRNIIYEICNEPNGGTTWSTIKAYANKIIPIIRKNDPEGIILVGTPEWSSQPEQAANDKITGNNAYNVMYTFHFYSGSHYGDYQTRLQNAASRIPVFVSEWGTTNANGDGWVDAGNSDTWINIMKNLKISWANWSFSDKAEGTAALVANACSTKVWTNRTASGNYVFNKITTADGFTQCQAAGDDDKDGVPNADDKCAGTATGTLVDATGCPVVVGDADKDGVTGDGVTGGNDMCPNTPLGSKVNAWGCPLDQNFVSNVCMGYNNLQGYARNDFSVDSLTNVDFWNRPADKSPVYSSVVSGGKLVVTVTNGDPAYKTMGFSFGKKFVPNGSKFDTTLYTLDVRKYPVVSFDMILNPSSSYTIADAVIDVQIEDIYGNSLSTDKLKNLHRKVVSVRTQTTITCDFAGGFLQSYDSKACGSGILPCYFNTFDFSKVAKVKVWVNPGAGSGNWTRAAYNGTWTFDNFSIGFNSSLNYTPTCTSTRDDDKDGVIQEKDRCQDTPPGATVNTNGCAQSQLDDDKDGVVNSNDICPNTPTGLVVNSVGCSAAQGDDDGDGVKNDKDQCPGTSPGSTVNVVGCVVTGLEDEKSYKPSVYPIPASDKLTINQVMFEYNRAILMDIRGNVMQEITLTKNSETISLENVSKGIYIVQLSGATKSELLRVVVQ